VRVSDDASVCVCVRVYLYVRACVCVGVFLGVQLLFSYRSVAQNSQLEISTRYSKNVSYTTICKNAHTHTHTKLVAPSRPSLHISQYIELSGHSRSEFEREIDQRTGEERQATEEWTQHQPGRYHSSMVAGRDEPPRAGGDLPRGSSATDDFSHPFVASEGLTLFSSVALQKGGGGERERERESGWKRNTHPCTFVSTPYGHMSACLFRSPLA
jgi:hypothetical protein